MEEASDDYEMDAGAGAVTSESGIDPVMENGRKLIKNVRLEMQTREYDQVIERLTKKVQEIGGYVENSSVWGSSIYQNSTRNSEYTVRIPSDRLNEFVDVVSGLGNVTYKSESVEDVTLQYVDVESRKKALETEQDRKKTMIITPFMSCSARLPIYVIFSEMFFPDCAGLVAFSFYMIGMAVAIITALVTSRIRKERTNNSLLIELPEYKRPNVRTVGIYVWNKLKDYLTKAGTTIFIASIVIWFVLNFGIRGMVDNPADSFGAMIGRLLVPLLAPAGLGMWQIAVALISGISAKEVVVSSFSVLFGVSNTNSAAGMASIVANVQAQNPAFGPLNA